jgi:exodeoxyribonuclease X
MLLRVIDIETTGTEPPAEIIEFGFCDVVVDISGITVSPPTSWLYRPLNGIPPETKAVHHLTEADFSDDMDPATPGHMQAAIAYAAEPDVLVAHNCAFERIFLPDAVTSGQPWICTYKVALHVWPNAPKHSNQVLRYWREYALDPALAMPPHRAGPDACVTANILADLLQFATVEEMINWTAQPKPMPHMTFGKHRGAAWADVPLDYLEWIIRQDMDPDIHWHANAEINRRTPRRSILPSRSAAL